MLSGESGGGAFHTAASDAASALAADLGAALPPRAATIAVLAGGPSRAKSGRHDTRGGPIRQTEEEPAVGTNFESGRHKLSERGQFAKLQTQPLLRNGVSVSAFLRATRRKPSPSSTVSSAGERNLCPRRPAEVDSAALGGPCDRTARRQSPITRGIPSRRRAQSTLPPPPSAAFPEAPDEPRRFFAGYFCRGWARDAHSSGACSRSSLSVSTQCAVNAATLARRLPATRRDGRACTLQARRLLGSRRASSPPVRGSKCAAPPSQPPRATPPRQRSSERRAEEAPPLAFQTG